MEQKGIYYTGSVSYLHAFRITQMRESVDVCKIIQDTDVDLENSDDEYPMIAEEPVVFSCHTLMPGYDFETLQHNNVCAIIKTKENEYYFVHEEIHKFTPVAEIVSLICYEKGQMSYCWAVDIKGNKYMFDEQLVIPGVAGDPHEEIWIPANYYISGPDGAENRAQYQNPKFKDIAYYYAKLQGEEDFDRFNLTFSYNNAEFDEAYIETSKGERIEFTRADRDELYAEHLRIKGWTKMDISKLAI